MRINVAVLGSAAVWGYGAWMYLLKPYPDVPLVNHGADQVIDFMENTQDYWSHEATTFANTPSALTRLVEHPRSTDGPNFEVTVNTKRFDGVPLRRVTAFFPNVTPRDVAVRFIEPSHRRRWDKNYRFFEEFVTFPCPKLVQHLRSGFQPTSRMWCGHVIESSTLDKVGVKPRSFIYERIVGERDDGSYCVVYRGIDGSEQDTFPAGHNGRPSPLGAQALQPATDGTATPPTLSSRLRSLFFTGPAAKTQEVTMLWQELLLLPVRRRHLELTTYDIKKGLIDSAESLPSTMGVNNACFAVAHAFMKEGSPIASKLHNALYVTDRDATGNLRTKAKTTDAEAAKRNEVVGCLMVMTSCNEAKLPTLPGPLERLAMKFLTNNTYEMLLADIAASKHQVVAAPAQRSS